MECELLALGVGDAVLRARRVKTCQHNGGQLGRTKHLPQPHDERGDDSAVNNDPMPWRVLGDVSQKSK